MVRDKIKLLKTMHNQKIDLLKKHHKNINGVNIMQYESALKEVEALIRTQLKILTFLEKSYTFEEKYQDVFDKEFSDGLGMVKKKIEQEQETFKKVNNPYYDGSLRYEKYQQFVKDYEHELSKKKSFLELLKEKVTFKTNDYKTIEELNDAAEHLQEEKKESKLQDPDTSSHEAVEEEPTSMLEEREDISDVKEKNTDSTIDDEKLISKLQERPTITTEFDVKKAVFDNNIKLKVEVKIMNTLENTAWGFMYQKYHTVDSKSIKSGQIKDHSKLLDIRQEALDVLYFDLKDEISNNADYEAVKKAIFSALAEDGIDVY